MMNSIEEVAKGYVIDEQKEKERLHAPHCSRSTSLPSVHLAHKGRYSQKCNFLI